MLTATLTKAGHRAPAGVARLGAVVPSGRCTGFATLATYAAAGAHQVDGWHKSAFRTVGTLVEPTAIPVFAKNRPARPLSERSP